MRPPVYTGTARWLGSSMGLVIAEVYWQLSKPVSRDFGNPWHIDAWIDAAGRLLLSVPRRAWPAGRLAFQIPARRDPAFSSCAKTVITRWWGNPGQSQGCVGLLTNNVPPPRGSRSPRTHNIRSRRYSRAICHSLPSKPRRPRPEGAQNQANLHRRAAPQK